MTDISPCHNLFFNQNSAQMICRGDIFIYILCLPIYFNISKYHICLRRRLRKCHELTNLSSNVNGELNR